MAESVIKNFALTTYGEHQNLGDGSNTTETQVTVDDLQKYRYILVGVVAGQNYNILAASTFVPVELFKRLLQISANFYDGTRLCAFAKYVDNTHVKLWVVGSGIKSVIWGIK